MAFDSDMKTKRLRAEIFYVILFTCLMNIPVLADEIPVIDVSQAVAQPEQTSQAQPPREIILPPLPNREASPQAAVSTTPEQVEEAVYPKRLRLFLRELSILQQAARSAGGDIQVSITPVGITAEDLIVPLTQSGWFSVRPEGDVIVVESRQEDPRLAQLKAENIELEKRRRVLLGQIEILERLAAEAAQSAVRSNPQLSATKPSIPTGAEPQFSLSTVSPPASEPAVISPKAYQQVWPPTAQPSAPTAPTTVYRAPAPSPANVGQARPVPSTVLPSARPATSADSLNRSVNPSGVSGAGPRWIVPQQPAAAIQTQPEDTLVPEPAPLVINPGSSSR